MMRELSELTQAVTLLTRAVAENTEAIIANTIAHDRLESATRAGASAQTYTLPEVGRRLRCTAQVVRETCERLGIGVINPEGGRPSLEHEALLELQRRMRHEAQREVLRRREREDRERRQREILIRVGRESAAALRNGTGRAGGE